MAEGVTTTGLQQYDQARRALPGVLAAELRSAAASAAADLHQRRWFDRRLQTSLGLLVDDRSVIVRLDNQTILTVSRDELTRAPRTDGADS